MKKVKFPVAKVTERKNAEGAQGDELVAVPQSRAEKKMAKLADKIASKEKSQLEKQQKKEKQQALKEKKKQKQLKDKLKKVAQKQKDKARREKEKIQRKDPAWQAQQKAKKRQEKLQKRKQQQQDKIRKRQERQKQKMQKKAERLKRKDPAWQQKQKEEKSQAVLKAKQAKILAQEKKRQAKIKDKLKRQQLKEKEKAKKAFEREQRKNPEWVQQQKEKKAVLQAAAKAKKQKQKEKDALKKQKLKEKKLHDRLKKKGITDLENYSARPGLSKQKKIIISVIVAVLLGIGGGAGVFTWQHPTPEKVVDRYLQAFQQQKFEAMDQYGVHNPPFISKTIMDDPMYSSVREIMIQKVYDLEYTLGEVQTNGDTATMVVNFKAYNLGEAMQTAISAYKKENIVKYVSGKYPKEELDAKLIEKLVQNLGAVEKNYEEAVIVNLLKVNGKWRIDSLGPNNPQLTKLLTGCVYAVEEQPAS